MCKNDDTCIVITYRDIVENYSVKKYKCYFLKLVQSIQKQPNMLMSINNHIYCTMTKHAIKDEENQKNTFDRRCNSTTHEESKQCKF